MSYSFEIDQDRSNNYRARFVAPDGTVLFVTKAYPVKERLLQSIKDLRGAVRTAPSVDLTEQLVVV